MCYIFTDHVDSCNNSTDFKNVEFVVKSSRESPVMAHPEGTQTPIKSEEVPASLFLHFFWVMLVLGRCSIIVYNASNNPKPKYMSLFNYNISNQCILFTYTCYILLQNELIL